MLVLATVIGQAVLLVGMVAANAAPLVFGETVRLKVVPVDPRDLFRGDYVVLGYDFTRHPQNQIAGLPAVQDYSYSNDGREVFVALKPSSQGEYYETGAVSVTRPAGQYLRGEISGWQGIRCGIEAWYVQEGEGRAIEQAIRSGKQVYADVAVWRGTARLKDVVIR
jgi:uncharacterized membrane-anchored protein